METGSNWTASSTTHFCPNGHFLETDELPRVWRASLLRPDLRRDRWAHSVLFGREVSGHGNSVSWETEIWLWWSLGSNVGDYGAVKPSMRYWRDSHSVALCWRSQ